MRYHGVFVTGTDTGVGKTMVAAALAAWARRHGFDIGVMKPVATGGRRRRDRGGARLVSDDAVHLARASGAADPWALINPVCFAEPIAPWTAAQRAGATIRLSRVARAFETLARRHDAVIVEGIGGLLVPLTATTTVADLARRLRLPLVIVARPGLGTLNHTLLTLAAARAHGVPVCAVILNHAQPPHRSRLARRIEQSNAVTLRRLAGVPVLGPLPFLRAAGRRKLTPSHRCGTTTPVSVGTLLAGILMQKEAWMHKLEQQPIMRVRRAQAPHIVRASAGQAGKMVVPLLGVLAVLSMAVAAVAIVLQSQEREKRQARERELQVALADNDDLKLKLQQTQQGKAAVEDELGRTRKDLTRSTDELAAAVQTQETLTKSVEDREREIARLTRDFEQTKGEAQQLRTQLSSLQSERDAARRQLAEVEKAKGELESKVMELSDRPTVELGRVRVTNPGGAAITPASPKAALMSAGASSAPGNQGQVVVVNREYDFVVMNLGKNHGLSIGQEFQIVRDNQVLGKVKVEKVYDELSAAAILPESQKDNIREGDAIRAL